MYRFGEHEVDLPAREVRCGGSLVHLEPQAFDLLVHLLEHRDRVVPKDELLDAVWGHRFVSEAALTTRIKEIRRALGDDGRRQTVVRNVPGHGYRFIAELVDDRDMVVTLDHGATGLVGRDALLSTVVDLCGGASVVTLLGPGGVGKSTLANAAMRARHLAWGDQVAVVDLATLRDDDEVLPAMAQALDTLLEAGHESRACSAMASRSMLVVLDNCEHVVDEVSAVLNGVYATPGVQLRVLATSQVRLGLANELVVAVEPLEVHDAVALFVRRALAVRTGFDGVAMMARLEALVEHLDRLPLTLEMAAARLGSMTFDDLEAAVLSPARSVQVTHRTPARRHRTLSSVVEWSAALLDDEQRAALTECAVFAGWFGGGDAAAVLSSADAAPGLVAGLVERSLLSADLDSRSSRYRMLETVKSVTATWLDRAPTIPAIRDRHARWAADQAADIDRRLRTTDEPAARHRLGQIVADLRRSYPWMATAHPSEAAGLSASLHHAAYSTFWREPAVWSKALLDRHPDLDAATLAGAHIVVAADAANRGHLDVARTHLVPLVDLDDAFIIGAVLEVMSDVELYSGDLAGALRSVRRLGEIGRELGDEHLVAWADVNFALASTFADEPEAALDRLHGTSDRALAPSDLAWLAYARGEALAGLGRPGAADEFMRAIDLARSVGNPFVVSVGQQALAAWHARAGDLTAALAMYRECLRGSLLHGNMVHGVTTVRNLVELLVSAGELRGAATMVGAMSRPELRQSYGTEADRQHHVADRLLARLGRDTFDEDVASGRRLDIDDAVRRAAELVDALQ